MPLIPSQQAAIDRGELIRVTVLPGKTVRGTTYFQETELLLSPEYAKYLSGTGDVRYNDIGGMHLSDPDSFKGPKDEAPPYMSGHDVQKRFNPD